MVAKKSHKRILIIEDERPMAKTLKARQEVLNQQRDIEYVRKDGTRFPVAISVSPMAVGGELIGAVEVFRDITKEQQVDKALRGRLRLVVRQPDSLVRLDDHIVGPRLA